MEAWLTGLGSCLVWFSKHICRYVRDDFNLPKVCIPVDYEEEFLQSVAT